MERVGPLDGPGAEVREQRPRLEGGEDQEPAEDQEPLDGHRRRRVPRRWILARARAAIPLAIVVVVFVAHFGGIITSYDSRWSIPTARSILHEGNTDLQEYQGRKKLSSKPGSKIRSIWWPWCLSIDMR